MNEVVLKQQKNPKHIVVVFLKEHDKLAII